MMENPLAMLRQFKGAPLSVYIALTIVRQPVTAYWLSTVTGYENQAITRALYYLKELQYVTCDSHRSNWQLSNALQLPLPLNSKDIVQDHENHDPRASSSSSSLNKKVNICSEGGGGDLKSWDHENHDPDHENHDPKLINSDLDHEIRRELLYRFGVGEPTLSRLLTMDHTDYEYLIAHVTKAQLEGIPPNYLIQRIQCNDAKPDTNDIGHAKGCTCSEACAAAQRRSYYRGWTDED